MTREKMILNKQKKVFVILGYLAKSVVAFFVIYIIFNH